MKQSILTAMIILSTVISKAATTLSYQLTFPEAQAHYVNVEMNLTNLKGDFTDVKMPVWTPGSYLVREFARHVDGFVANTNKGTALKVEKISKSTWRIYHQANADIKINYRVYAFELTVRTSFIDASQAYLNGASIFMYVDKMLDLPTEIKVVPTKDWKKISCSLPTKGGDAYTLVSANYDELADSPIEIGNQEILEFVAAGIPHKVAMIGAGNYDPEKIKRDFTKIIEEETKVFGKNPCKNYVFFVHNVNAGGGGLEHLNSNTVLVQRFAYANEATYNSFLSLIAHEYFHLWNVKRLRPSALGPFDYDNENYTRMLWVSEGFTAFYDNWIVRRCGFYTADKYLEIVANEISGQRNLKGDKIMSLSEASFDAWIKYYRRNENSNNTQVSYYDKGSAMAGVINMMILKNSGDTKNLDDLMRFMYNEYYEKAQRGFTDAEMKKALEEFTGQNLDSFYAKYIDGLEAIDFESYYANAGIKFTDLNKDKKDALLGAATVAKDGKTTVTAVEAGTAAYQYGLNVNDELIAIDQYRIDDLAKLLALKKAGDKISMTISRDGVLKNIDLVLGQTTAVKYKFERVDSVSLMQENAYKNWMGITK